MSALGDGFLQPLLVPAQAMALLALGLLLGQQGRSSVPAVGFAAGLAGGLAAIALAVGQTAAGDVLLLAAAVNGMLVALARAVPTLICALLAAITGTALGLDSPPQVISIGSATLMLIGNGLGAGALLTIIVVSVGYCRRDWQRIGMRILGSWIAASAVLVLALRYTRGMLF